MKLPYPHFSKNKETVKCPKNKHLTRQENEVDEVDGEDEVENEQEEKNKNDKRMLVESKWKYPP